jgi:hypothetical protein
MMKSLSLTAALVLAGACKTDSPSPANPPPATATGDEQPAKPAPAAKVNRPPPPSLPPVADDAQAQAGDHPRDRRGMRDEWRSRRESQMDTNGDGVVSDEERTAAMRERTAALRERFDADGDGKLTVSELANAQGRLRFEDPAALDTDHDGNISADELAAGLRARREQRRAGRGSNAQTTE